MKEVRYNPSRPADDPRDGPATYRHRSMGLILTSDRWTVVDEASAEALRLVPGIEIRESATGVHVQESPGAAASSRPDAPGGSTPMPEPAGVGAQSMTPSRKGRRRGGPDG
jgi:hypothetical protein